MIQIDLLPDDLRKVEHTPYPRLIVILVGVIGFVALVFLNINLYFIRMPEKAKTLADAEQKLKDKKLEVDIVKALEKELATMRKRRDTVISLVLDRVRMAKKLDLLSQVVEKLPSVWFSSMNIKKDKKKGRGRRGAPEEVLYKIDLQATAVMDMEQSGLNLIAGVHHAFKSEPGSPNKDYFYNQIQTFDIPGFNMTEFEEYKYRLITFSINMEMNPKLNRNAERMKKREELEKRKKPADKKKKGKGKKQETKKVTMVPSGSMN